jgi:NAD(P)-dependent dehydrogenase (short-subunit alcohol dehydrogenase family)
MPAVRNDQTNVFVITGGGRGIGAAVARRLAERAESSTHLVINYAASEATAHQVKTEVEAVGDHVTASAVQADVSRADHVAALFAAADSAGTLVGLVNNAAVIFSVGPFLDLTVERLERTWAVNITGAFLCAQEAVKRLSKDQGGAGGSIVNVSSRAASFGSPNEFIDYAASKGALDSMTRGLSTEVAKQGIRVNAVRPGLIDTDIHASAGWPDRIGALAHNVPMGRGGTPAEVANLITWLLSDESSYVTGALIDIGGGR